jgi:hypothetical protein
VTIVRTILALTTMLCVLGSAQAQPLPRFTDVTAESRIWDVPTAWGVTVEDLDGDGDLDLAFANNGSENAVFYNLGGLQFWGRPIVGGHPGTEALAPADLDGDGDLDLLACCWGGFPTVWHNDGTGRFADVTEEVGIEPRPDAQNGGAAIGDVDRDGILDIFLPDGNGKDVLYAEVGGVYQNVTEPAGLREVPGGESAAFADVDDDGDLDLYVARSSDKSALYLNQGGGTFEDLSAITDVFAAGGNCGVVFADFDNDGDLDLLQVNGVFGGANANRLLRNDGEARFAVATPAAWPDEPSRWFTAAVGDIDNDGDLDVYFTGFERNLLFLNQGGLQFAPAPDPCPLDGVSVGCGALFVDLDGDGDLDLVTRRRPGADRILRNDLNNGNWLEVRPIARDGNRYCLGARVRVFRAGGLGDMQAFVARRDLVSPCGWCSYQPYLAHFGLDATQRYDIEVRFADGSTATATNVQPGRYVEVKAP